MSRWTTRVDPVTGRVVKSGIDARPVSRTRESAVIAGYKYRAVVLATYATNASIRTQLNENTTRKYEIECDVLLLKSSVFYPRVPVVQRDHGVNNANLWLPRPTTRVIDGSALNFTRVSARGTKQTIPQNPEELDGDIVVLEFLEGDLEMPIITGAFTHPKTNRLVIEGSGWSESLQGTERGTPHQNEKYIRYRGVELRINDNGDVLIDTVGATKDESNEVPAATGGQVRVRVKSTERFTVQMGTVDVLEVWQDPLTQQVHIDLGEDADEAIVRGNKLTTWLLAHIHPDAVGGTAPPIDPAGVPPVSLAIGDHLSDDHKVK
jgi:hypothetical protein